MKPDEAASSGSCSEDLERARSLSRRLTGGAGVAGSQSAAEAGPRAFVSLSAALRKSERSKPVLPALGAAPATAAKAVPVQPPAAQPPLAAVELAQPERDRSPTPPSRPVQLPTPAAKAPPEGTPR